MRRIAITVLALCFALAACGGGGQLVSIEEMQPAERAEFLAAASTETVDAGSSRMYFEMAFGDVGAMTGSGLFDMEAEIGHLTFDFGEFAAALGAPPGTDATAEYITVGFTMYMRMPFLAQATGIGDRWIRMDLDSLSGEAGVDLGQLAEAGSNSPTQSLAFLQGADPETITEVGQEEITLAGGDGPTVKATHFRATVDLRVAYENAGAVTDPERFEAFIAQLGTAEIEVDGWIDEDDRVVRMAFAMPVPPQPGSPFDSVAMTMDLYEFGVQVDITEPSTDEYVDIQDLMGPGAG